MKNLYFAFGGLLLAGLATGCGQQGGDSAQNTTATTTSATNAPSDTTGLNKKADWWKETIVYQLYPRSFQDSNGDGVGDLPGIIQRLDYLKGLGIGTVWLNPIYASPNDDNGYDISNYEEIMPDFGTMADFNTLLKGMHARGIKLVMDVVVNHTSDEHEWFKQARSSRTNPYRDYYYWWPAEKGTPPKRYSSFDVKKNAWKYDSLTKSYYLHYFSQKQPDLNWTNPKVRQEVYKMLRFWADKGVDGFRMDAFQFVAKDPTFPAMTGLDEDHYADAYNHGPHLHDYLQEMNREVFSHYNLMTVAEGAGRNVTEAMDFVDPARKELDMTYHFEGTNLDRYKDTYSLVGLKKILTKWDSAFAQKGWQALDLANHDQPRLTTKFGDDRPEFRAHSAQLLNTFLLTMRGTPYCYYGDELGMTNIKFTRSNQYQDIAARNGYALVKEQKGDTAAYLHYLARFSRDNGRTPMQWSDAKNAGFTTGTPWLPVNPNYTTVNVAVESKDAASVLAHFKQATALRQAHPQVLVYGAYQLLDRANPHIWAYTRTQGAEKALVVLNFSSAKQNWAVPAGLAVAGAPWLNNYPTVPSGPTMALEPWQAVVLPLK